MFKPSDFVINAFIRELRKGYAAGFGDGTPGHADLVAEVARSTLGRIARSNALYHDLDHTIIVTQVGIEIMQGRMIRDADVVSLDWVHYVVSLLCFSIGFVRDVCPGDAPGQVVIEETGRTAAMPRGATDGYLWQYAVERGMLYVRTRFRHHPVLNPEILAGQIEYARFPPLSDRNPETATYGGLLRAAHFIGAAADPNFMAKMRPLFLELQESGIATQFGFGDAAQFRAAYVELFWNILHKMTRDGAALLAYTANGRQWLANMYAQVLAEEHQQPAMGVARIRHDA